MRSFIRASVAICMSLALAGLQEVAGQARAATPTQDDSQLATEWKAVKERYPRVAMEYMRREALAYSLAHTLLVAQEAEGRPMMLPARIVTSVWVCGLFRRLGVSPLPTQCEPIEVPPLGDIGACFEPQPSSEGRGQYEMPSVEDAEACVRAALRPRP